jgi:hypothetical protein
MNLAETDGTESDDCHIKGVEKFPPLDPHITCNSKRYEETQYYKGYFQMPDRVHAGLL